MFPTSKITSKGQTTIPKKVRDAMGLEEGDTIAFVCSDKGVLMVPRNRSIDSIFGILADHASAVKTQDDYDNSVRDGVTEHVNSDVAEFRNDAA